MAQCSTRKSNASKAQSILDVERTCRSLQYRSYARKAQSMIDGENTWLGAVETKCQEDTVYHH